MFTASVQAGAAFSLQHRCFRALSTQCSLGANRDLSCVPLWAQVPGLANSCSKLSLYGLQYHLYAENTRIYLFSLDLSPHPLNCVSSGMCTNILGGRGSRQDKGTFHQTFFKRKGRGIKSTILVYDCTCLVSLTVFCMGLDDHSLPKTEIQIFPQAKSSLSLCPSGTLLGVLFDFDPSFTPLIETR